MKCYEPCAMAIQQITKHCQRFTCKSYCGDKEIENVQAAAVAAVVRCWWSCASVLQAIGHHGNQAHSGTILDMQLVHS